MNHDFIFLACNNLLHIKAAVTLSYQLNFLLNSPSQFELNGEFDDRQVSAGPRSDIGRVGKDLQGDPRRFAQAGHSISKVSLGECARRRTHRGALKHHFVAYDHILTHMIPFLRKSGPKFAVASFPSTK